MESWDVLEIHGALRRSTLEVQYLLNLPCIFNTSLDSMLYLLSILHTAILTNVVSYFKLQQKWHILKSHMCRVFWWCLQPFLWKTGMVWGFGNYRGHFSFLVFSPSALFYYLLLGAVGLSAIFVADFGSKSNITRFKAFNK